MLPRLLSGRSLCRDVLLPALEPAFSRSLLDALDPAFEPAREPSRLPCFEPELDFAGFTVTTEPASSTFDIVLERWLDGRADETCDIESQGATEPRSSRDPSYSGRALSLSFSVGAFEGALDGAFDAFDGAFDVALESGSPIPAAEGAVEEREMPRIVTSEILVVEVVRECVDFGGARTGTSVGEINELTSVEAVGRGGSMRLDEWEEDVWDREGRYEGAWLPATDEAGMYIDSSSTME